MWHLEKKNSASLVFDAYFALLLFNVNIHSGPSGNRMKSLLMTDSKLTFSSWWNVLSHMPTHSNRHSNTLYHQILWVQISDDDDDVDHTKSFMDSARFPYTLPLGYSTRESGIHGLWKPRQLCVPQRHQVRECQDKNDGPPHVYVFTQIHSLWKMHGLIALPVAESLISRSSISCRTLSISKS